MIDEGVRLFQQSLGQRTVRRGVLHDHRIAPDSRDRSGSWCSSLLALRYKSGRSDADDIEITGLYWHFVDLVWMFVVPLVYLLNVSK